MNGQVSQMENGPVDWVLVDLDLGTNIYIAEFLCDILGG